MKYYSAIKKKIALYNNMDAPGEQNSVFKLGPVIFNKWIFYESLITSSNKI